TSSRRIQKYPKLLPVHEPSVKWNKRMKEELRHEKELRKKLEAEVQRTKDELEELKKEQESLIDIFSEDRDRGDKEEENLRNKLEVLIHVWFDNTFFSKCSLRFRK
ncbi:unnamed protein product, partial [Brassica rapa subsp. trilocularis]